MSQSAAASPRISAAPEFIRAHAIGVAKAAHNIVRLADRPISGAFAPDGNYFAFPEGFFDIGNWTSSFFTGAALLAYEANGDAALLEPLDRLSGVYREKVTTRAAATMHDLGFLYSLYSVPLYQLTRRAEHRATALIAADELARRFSAGGRYIQAWGRMDERNGEYAGLAIIDCMMNLPLLFWAARETGNRFYHEIAVAHADTTSRHFIRADDSVCHAFRFDLATGQPRRAENYCGYAVDSHWARGTTWAIYGFALAFRHTRDAGYLDVAARLARKFLSLLDAELIPVWDFRAPRTSESLRDSSAAAIAVCALDELALHRPDPEFIRAADALLHRLCRGDYLDSNPACPGLLRGAEVGAGPGEVTGTIKPQSVYASWGDYYFMEALTRRLRGTAGWW